MKKKVYVVIDCDYPQYQNIFGSKKKLLESFLESELEGYNEEIEQIIENREGICDNCKNDIEIKTIQLDSQYNYLHCVDCNLFYCNNCVKACSKCNKTLSSRSEINEKFKDKIKINFEKDGISSLENNYFDCEVKEELIEFSDDDQ